MIDSLLIYHKIYRLCAEGNKLNFFIALQNAKQIMCSSAIDNEPERLSHHPQVATGLRQIMAFILPDAYPMSEFFDKWSKHLFPEKRQLSGYYPRK